jgi:hypothetical protein
MLDYGSGLTFLGAEVNMGVHLRSEFLGREKILTSKKVKGIPLSPPHVQLAELFHNDAYKSCQKPFDYWLLENNFQKANNL